MNPAQHLPTGAERGQLHLIFSLGADRYALAIHQVRELLPLQPLKQLPQAPTWVAGILLYRGQTVPVIDLYQRCLGRPAQVRTSTRLVVADYQGQPLGLLLEQASHLRRLVPQQGQSSGLENSQPGYLGELYTTAEARLIQRIRVEGLLPDDVAAQLYPAPGANQHSPTEAHVDSTDHRNSSYHRDSSYHVDSPHHDARQTGQTP